MSLDQQVGGVSRQAESENHLPEMPVRRDCVRQAKLPHNHKTRAVGERKLLVTISKEQVERFKRGLTPCLNGLPTSGKD